MRPIKSNPNMVLRHRIVRSSSHVLAIGCILLLISLWPLLVSFGGWSFSYILATFPCIISLPLAAGFVIGCVVELLRRGWNFRVFITLLVSGLAVSAWVLFFVLRFRNMANGAA